MTAPGMARALFRTKLESFTTSPTMATALVA